MLLGHSVSNADSFFSFSYKTYYFATYNTICSLVQIDTVDWKIVRSISRVCPFFGLVGNDNFYFVQMEQDEQSIGKLNLQTFELVTWQNKQFFVDMFSLFVTSGSLYFSVQQEARNFVARLNESWQYEIVKEYESLTFGTIDKNAQYAYYFGFVNDNCTLFKVSFPDFEPIASMDLSLHIMMPMAKLQILDGGTMLGMGFAASGSAQTVQLLKFDVNAFQLLLSGPIPSNDAYSFSAMFGYYISKNKLHQLSLQNFKSVNILDLQLSSNDYTMATSANGLKTFVAAKIGFSNAFAFSIDNRCNIGEYIDANFTCLTCPNTTLPSKTYNATSCGTCALGALFNGTACVPCIPGYFSNSSMPSRCEPCPMFSFGATPGLTACSPCATAKTIASTTCIIATDYTILIIALTIGAAVAMLLAALVVAIFICCCAIKCLSSRSLK